jgi:hypothetical protein
MSSRRLSVQGPISRARELAARGDSRSGSRSRSARPQVPESDGRGSRRKPMPWPSTTRHRRCGLSSYARRVSTRRAAAVSRSREIWQLLQVRHVDDVPLILVGKMWKGLVDWAKTSMLDMTSPLPLRRTRSIRFAFGLPSFEGCCAGLTCHLPALRLHSIQGVISPRPHHVGQQCGSVRRLFRPV